MITTEPPALWRGARSHRRRRTPLLGAGPITAARRFWTGYFTFSGRASRSEFWWQRLVDVVVVVVVITVVPLVSGIPNDSDSTFQNTPGYNGIGQTIFGLNFHTAAHGGLTVYNGGTPTQWVLLVWFAATVIPNLALGFRRMRDLGHPGWFALFGGFPIVDFIMMVMALYPSFELQPVQRRGARHMRRGSA